MTPASPSGRTASPSTSPLGPWKNPLEWNASLIKGDLAESVTSLKHQHRGNLISFGCGEFAYELATRGLADEIHFWVGPAVWGSGDRAFHGRQVRMRLIATTAFDSGVVLLAYRPTPDEQASPAT
jgi:dihydrofolate reductase